MIGTTISHYKILDKLGSGGMGDVYKAEDTKLKRTVALKFLPSDLTRDKEARQRFVHEAQAASALDHPNIGTIYEIDEADGQSFIAMAYYPGQTLKDRIDQGALSIDEVIDITVQIAKGLDKAHGKEIVHRDIKPSNIILTEDGLVKIVDFGLAKLTGQTKLTRTGSTMGTIAYMSPQQADGTHVDHRTDIWSLGVVLYEMLTGELPFKGEFEPAVLYSILHEDPQFITKLRADVPREMEAIAEKAIAKNPEERSQSMEEILTALQTLKENLRKGELKKRRPVLRLHKKQRRKLYQVATVAVAAIIILSVYLWQSRVAEATPVSVAVVDFTNTTDEKELDGLSGLLITSLEQSRHLSVLTRARMFDILRQLGKENVEHIDESIGREICKKANVSTMIAASIRKLGERYAIDLKVLDTQKEEYLFTAKEEDESPENIFSMIDRLAERTRRGLNEDEAKIQMVSLSVAAVTTPNLDAYYHYFKGEELVNKYRFEEAQEAFKKAISIDSTFGLAYYRLAYAITWIETEAYLAKEPFQKALSHIDGIPEKERFLVRAEAARQKDGYAEATMVLKEMQQIYPNDKEMLFLLGDYSFHTGQYLRAAGYFENVMRIDSTQVRTLEHLALSYENLKKYLEAESLLHKALELHPGSTGLINRLARLYADQNKYSSAEAVAREGLKSQPTDLVLLSLLGELLNDQRKYGEAEEVFRKQLALKPDDTALLSRWGWILNNQRKYVEAEEAFREGLKSNIDNNQLHNGLGWSLYWQRRYPEAEKVFRKASELFPNDVAIINGLQSSLRSQRKYADAETVVRSAFESNPTSVLLSNALGQLLTDQRKYAAAEEVFRKSLELNPQNASTFSSLGWSLFSQRKYPQAEEVFRKGFEIDPNNIAIINGVSSSLSAQKKYIEAEEVLRNAQESNPNNAYIPFYLGRLFNAQGKYNDAEESLRKGIALNPNDILLLGMLGWSLVNQDKFAEAEKFFQRGFEINSNHLTIINGLGSLKIRQKKYDDATRLYEKYLQISNRPHGKRSLGGIELLRKNYTLAEKHLIDAYSLDSTSVWTLQPLAYLYTEQNLFDEAFRYASKAALGDSSYATNNLMGWVLVAGNRDLDRGIAFAERALASKPDSWQRDLMTFPYYAIPEHTLGLAYSKKGEYKKAAQYLKKAAEFAPDRQSLQNDLQVAREALREMSKK